MSELFEYCHDSGSAWKTIWGASWAAQSFTPEDAHKITSVKLYLHREGYPGTLTVSIRATDGSSHPTGGDLCSGTIDGDTLIAWPDGEWREATLGAGYNLSPGVKYAIVIRALDGDNSNCVRWLFDNSDPTYEGGCYESSNDSGSSWTSSTGTDFLFEDWGEWLVTPKTSSDSGTGVDAVVALETSLTSHIYYTQMPPSAHHDENLWLEPVPMEPQTEQGLAICHQGDFAWLTNANKVYRASALDDELDISTKLLTVDLRQYPDIRKGSLKIAIDNTAGLYNSFARLGDEITIGIGYKTTAGNECSLASSFWIKKYKLQSPEWSFWRAFFPVGILGTLNIEAQDAWDFLKRYKTRRHLTWEAEEKSVKQILQFFFARAGLDFEVQSASDAATNFKPEFEVDRGTSYRTIIKNLLKMIPDQVIFREAKVILRNPTSDEAVDWEYHNIFGTANLVLRGKYGTSAWDPNRVEVWGDTFMKEDANWSQIQKIRDRLSRITTPTYPDVTRAGERAAAELRKAEVLTGEDSWLYGPVNCGLEPWDKLKITDTIAGVSNIYRRVIRLRLHWDKKSWAYTQTCILGAD